MSSRTMMAPSERTDEVGPSPDVLPFYPRSLCQRYRDHQHGVPAAEKEVLGHARIGWEPDYETYLAREAARRRVGGFSTSLPDDFPLKMKGDLVWSGTSNVDEVQYIFHLLDFQTIEVYEALKHFKALGLGLKDVCPQTFPLPTLKYQLCELSIEVHYGRGFCVLRGLDPKLSSPLDNLIIFLGITSYIAERRGRQDQNGNILVHIRDEPETRLSKRNRLSKDTNSSQPFHSDVHADILALYKLNDSAAGGESLLASTWTVYNELAATRPDLIDILAKPDWPFDTFGRDPLYYCRPLLFFHDSKLILSFSRRTLAGSLLAPRPSSLPPLSAAQAEALDAIHFIALKHSISIHSQSGDVQFINNLGLVHGRKAFQDDELNRRHMVRLWLRNDKLAWSLPPDLRIAHERTFGANEDLEDLWLVDPPPSKPIAPLLRHQGSCE